MAKSSKIETDEQPSRSRGLRDRLGMLRKYLGGSQAKLAREIGASPTQVTEWMKGTEQPSAKMLIAMGNKAPNLEDRLWFWRQAGIDEQRLLDDLRAENALDLRVPEGALELAAPLVEQISITNSGALRTEGSGDLRVPSVLSRIPELVFSLRVAKNPGFPQPFAQGDFVVIERPLPGTVFSEGALVAVFFERTPEGYELGDRTERFDEQVQSARAFRGRDRRELEEAFPEFANPLVLFGRLSLQVAGGRDEQRRNWKEWLTRVALNLSFSSTTASCIPLCEWQKGTNPIELQQKTSEHIEPPARLLGEVVGWFRNRATPGVSSPVTDARPHVTSARELRRSKRG